MDEKAADGVLNVELGKNVALIPSKMPHRKKAGSRRPAPHARRGGQALAQAESLSELNIPGFVAA